jgi:hypothetical protein
MSRLIDASWHVQRVVAREHRAVARARVLLPRTKLTGICMSSQPFACSDEDAECSLSTARRQPIEVFGVDAQQAEREERVPASSA